MNLRLPTLLCFCGFFVLEVYTFRVPPGANMPVHQKPSLTEKDVAMKVPSLPDAKSDGDVPYTLIRPDQRIRVPPRPFKHPLRPSEVRHVGLLQPGDRMQLLRVPPAQHHVEETQSHSHDHHLDKSPLGMLFGHGTHHSEGLSDVQEYVVPPHESQTDGHLNAVYDRNIGEHGISVLKDDLLQACFITQYVYPLFIPKNLRIHYSKTKVSTITRNEKDEDDLKSVVGEEVFEMCSKMRNYWLDDDLFAALVTLSTNE